MHFEILVKYIHISGFHICCWS